MVGFFLFKNRMRRIEEKQQKSTPTNQQIMQAEMACKSQSPRAQ